MHYGIESGISSKRHILGDMKQNDIIEEENIIEERKTPSDVINKTKSVNDPNE